MTTLVQTQRTFDLRAAFGSQPSFLMRLADWIAEHRRYRRTLAELSALSDRELDDIGLTRGNIQLVARRSARGF